VVLAGHYVAPRILTCAYAARAVEGGGAGPAGLALLVPRPGNEASLAHTDGPPILPSLLQPLSPAEW